MYFSCNLSYYIFNLYYYNSLADIEDNLDPFGPDFSDTGTTLLTATPGIFVCLPSLYTLYIVQLFGYYCSMKIDSIENLYII